MKTVIDLDTDLVARAAHVLGTETTEDTIHAALAAAIEAEERRRRLPNTVGSPDLGDEEFMSGAWS